MSDAKILLASVTILLFTGFFFSLGGGGIIENDVNISEDDLRIDPEIPDPSYQEIPLTNSINSENVSVQSIDPSQNDGYDEGLGLTSGSSSGFATFDLSGYVVARVDSTDDSIFSGCGITGTVLIDGSQDTRELCSSTNIDSIEEWDSSQIRIDFSDQDSYVYLIEASEVQDFGVLDRTSAYLSEFLSWILGYVQVIAGLPPALGASIGVLITVFLGFLAFKASTLL